MEKQLPQIQKTTSDIIPYLQGSIFWYINSDSNSVSENSISNHMVMIIEDHNHRYYSNTYCQIPAVVITTSTKRSGIKIMTPALNEQGFRYALIKPYDIENVNIKYLKEYVGRVSDNILKRVLNAVSYHLGITNEEPIYEKLEPTEVDNSNIKSFNTITKRATITKTPYMPNYAIAEIKKSTNGVNEQVQNANLLYNKMSNRYDIEEKIGYWEVELDTAIKKIHSSTLDTFNSNKEIIRNENCAHIAKVLNISAATAKKLKEILKKEDELKELRLLKELKSNPKHIDFLTKPQALIFTKIDDEMLGKELSKPIQTIKTLKERYNRTFS